MTVPVIAPVAVGKAKFWVWVAPGPTLTLRLWLV